MAKAGGVIVEVSADIRSFEQEMKKVTGTIDQLKATFGRGSTAWNIGKLLGGGGAIMAARLIGREVENATASIANMANAWRISSTEGIKATDAMIHGIPIIGSLIKGVENLIDAFTGLSAEQQLFARIVAGENAFSKMAKDALAAVAAMESIQAQQRELQTLAQQTGVESEWTKIAGNTRRQIDETTKKVTADFNAAIEAAPQTISGGGVSGLNKKAGYIFADLSPTVTALDPNARNRLTAGRVAEAGNVAIAELEKTREVMQLRALQDVNEKAFAKTKEDALKREQDELRKLQALNEKTFADAQRAWEKLTQDRADLAGLQLENARNFAEAEKKWNDATRGRARALGGPAPAAEYGSTEANTILATFETARGNDQARLLADMSIRVGTLADAVQAALRDGIKIAGLGVMKATP